MGLCRDLSGAWRIVLPLPGRGIQLRQCPRIPSAVADFILGYCRSLPTGGDAAFRLTWQMKNLGPRKDLFMQLSGRHGA